MANRYGSKMATSVRISEQLVNEAKTHGKNEPVGLLTFFQYHPKKNRA
jgi:hypothetical protein